MQQRLRIAADTLFEDDFDIFDVGNLFRGIAFACDVGVGRMV